MSKRKSCKNQVTKNLCSVLYSQVFCRDSCVFEEEEERSINENIKEEVIRATTGKWFWDLVSVQNEDKVDLPFNTLVLWIYFPSHSADAVDETSNPNRRRVICLVDWSLDDEEEEEDETPPSKRPHLSP